MSIERGLLSGTGASLGRIGGAAFTFVAVAVSGLSAAFVGYQSISTFSALRQEAVREMARRAEHFTASTRQMAASAVGLAKETGAISTSVLRPPGSAALSARSPFRCDTIDIIDPAIPQRHAAGDLMASGFADGDVTCIYWLLKNARAVSGPQRISRLSFILQAGLVTYPEMDGRKAILGRDASGFSALRRLKPDSWAEGVPFLVPPGNFALSDERSYGVAVLEAKGGTWQSVTLVEASPAEWTRLTDPVFGGRGEAAVITIAGEEIGTGGKPVFTPDEARSLLAASIDGFVARQGHFWSSASLGDGWYLLSRVRLPDVVLAVLRANGMVFAAGLLTSLLAWFTRWYVLVRLVEPSRRRDAAFRQRAYELWHALETMTDAVCQISPEMRLSTVNSRMSTLLGHPVPPADYGAVDDYPLLSYLREIIDQARSSGAVTMLDVQHADGRWYEARVQVAPSTGMASLILSDITQRKESEIQERQARSESQLALSALDAAKNELVMKEKMAAVGSLAAGLSQEMQRPLFGAIENMTAARSVVDALEEAMSQDHVAVDQIRAVRREIETAVKHLVTLESMTAEFKQMAVDSSGSRRPFLLDRWLQDILPGIEAEVAARGHKLEVRLEPGLLVELNPTHLWQALNSLVQNALTHAFPDRQGGTVSLLARSRGDHVAIVVADDGDGISATLLSRIFEPFVTTGSGLGLGLSIVQNLVHQSLGGEIRVETVAGAGTRITITVPMAAAVPDPPDPLEAGAR